MNQHYSSRANSSISSITAKRVRLLLDEARTSVKEFSRENDIPCVTIYNCINEKCSPSRATIDLLSKAFGVSSDYLTKENAPRTNDLNIKYMCEYLGINESAISKLHSYAEQRPIDENEQAEERPHITVGDFLSDFITSGALLKVYDLYSAYSEKASGVYNFKKGQKEGKRYLPEVYDIYSKAEESAAIARYRAGVVISELFSEISNIPVSVIT